MQEELVEFNWNQVWTPVPPPKDLLTIGTRRVFWNKLDDTRVTIRNKVRLVAKGFTQIEGLDYDETFASVAHLEAIWIFLAYAAHKAFKFYSLDIKSAFINGELCSEVYIQQPHGFVNLSYPNYYKLQKAIYDLNQSPCVWYETLTCFLKSFGFQRGILNPMLFRRSNGKDLMLVRVYVDDIIFGSTDLMMVADFAKLMVSRFQMSMNHELSFFLKLQVK